MDVPSADKNIPNHPVVYWLYLLLTAGGLSFLFFLGFPFANHNESYLWVVLFDKLNFATALTSRLEPVQSFRPLGTATAWATYKLTGNIYLQQLLNWLFACASYLTLFKYVANKTAFGLIAFVATTVFFSGYIYLFHLHGVFYGPLQLYIAALTCMAYRHKTIAAKPLALLFIITVLVALYHTFALLVFAGFLGGVMLQVPKPAQRTQLPRLLFFFCSSLLLIYIILVAHPTHTEGEVLQGSVASFTTTEINPVLSLIALLLTFATIYTSRIQHRQRHIIAAAVLVLAAGFAFFDLPILLFWIAACTIKTMLRRNWAIAAIIASTAAFPAATHTGTPTYIVFVIMVCVFVTALDMPGFKTPRWLNVLLGSFMLLAVVVLVLMKQGVKIPVATEILRPILAEQEKTHQLEKIIYWKKSVPAYTAYNLNLADESNKPSESWNAVNRNFRPPTQQKYLDRFCAQITPEPDAPPVPHLLVTFGGKELKDHKLIYKVKGLWSGDAYVYL